MAAPGLAALAPLEQATEDHLRRGDRESARAAAGECAAAVVERLDLGTARRWFAALPPRAGDGVRLATARLMLAVAGEDYGAGVEVAETYARAGRRAALARSSDRAAALMGLCYAGVGRQAEVEELFASAWPGPELDATVYARAGRVADAPRPTRPPPTDGPFDGLILTGDYLSGHVERLGEDPASPWAGAVSRVWKIGALRARGETDAALSQLDPQAQNQMRFRSLIGPELYLDAGRVGDARHLLAEGRRLATTQGSRFYLALGAITEAKIALRIDHDSNGAHRLLDRALKSDPFSPLVEELADTWRSLAHLREDNIDLGITAARRALDSMRRGRRLLERPTVAVHLAEALWRVGRREESEAAATEALEAAQESGLTHVLRQALTEFPDLVSRRIERGREADPAWHDLARELLAAKVVVRGEPRHRVHVREFGNPGLLVNGAEARPKLAKSIELLSYLAASTPEERRRTRVLEALFGDPSDESAKTYLRQSLASLRHLLPGGIDLTDPRAPFASLLDVTTDSASLDPDLAACSAPLPDDLARIEATLARLDSREFLPGARSPWVEERRRLLDDRAAEAHFLAATLALRLGRLDRARSHNHAVLAADPYREEAWSQRMRIAAALGDGDAVLAAFGACREHLAEVGRLPAPGIVALLEALRR